LSNRRFAEQRHFRRQFVEQVIFLKRGAIGGVIGGETPLCPRVASAWKYCRDRVGVFDDYRSVVLPDHSSGYPKNTAGVKKEIFSPAGAGSIETMPRRTCKSSHPPRLFDHVCGNDALGVSAVLLDLAASSVQYRTTLGNEAPIYLKTILRPTPLV
jgi:hypothetical protein